MRVPKMCFCFVCGLNKDAHADPSGVLHVDGHDDCRRASYKRRSDGSASFEFIRSFDTCHEEDYLIEDGTVHVVYASGPGPLYRSVIIS